jgi:hypothetical protein
MSIQASSVGAVIAGFGVAAGYLTFFWRAFKQNPGNRLIESGALALIVFMAMVPFSRIPGITDHMPDWILILWIFLVLLLSFSTLFFAVQRLWRAPARTKKQ